MTHFPEIRPNEYSISDIRASLVTYIPGETMPCDYGSRHPEKLPDNLTKEEREDLGIETEEEDTELWIGKLTQKVIPAITEKQLAEATFKDPELGPIVEEKKLLWRSKRSEKGPYGKIWGELEVRDGILLRGKRIVVPKSLQARAIALAHEGHMQTDRTLPLL